MMYRYLVVCILAIMLVMPLEGEIRGERYLLLNEINLQDMKALEAVTSLLKENTIPYVINLSHENIERILESREIIELINKHNVLSLPISLDLYSQGDTLKVMTFESVLHNEYKRVIHSSENLGIMVDIGKDDIGEILRFFIVNEVPIANLSDQIEHIEQWQLTEAKLFPETQAIDITNTNRIITLIMFIIGVIFIIFIAEGRKREKKKFFNKD